MVLMGLRLPSQRAVFAGTCAAGICYVTQTPAEAFNEDGSVRAWSVTSDDPHATDIHFLMVPLAVATAAYLFT